jgi:putative helicase
LDFYKINVKKSKSNNSIADYIVSPDFMFINSNDLICKGGEMYAFWYNNQWNTKIYDLISIIDNDITKEVIRVKEQYPGKTVAARYMRDNETKIRNAFSLYTKLAEQSDAPFNTRIFFDDESPKKKDYSTNKLNYHPVEGDTPAFDEMFSLLYDKPELEKIMWFIGATLTNNTSNIQKFLYLYGPTGTGKGTALKLIKMLFEGYYGIIDLGWLTGSSDFSTCQIQELPLLIDDDCNLATMKDDRNLLKLTGHDPIIVNIKHRIPFQINFNGFVIAASNQRYKVRDIDAGITRRAIVASPTHKKHKSDKYRTLFERLKFELPQIAHKCIQLFNEKGPYYYENYFDVNMSKETDIVFAFMREYYEMLGDETNLKKASLYYKTFLEDMGLDTKGHKKKMSLELPRYYEKYIEQKKVNGEVIKNVYSGFKYTAVFPDKIIDMTNKEEGDIYLESDLKEQASILDELCKDYPAQYADSEGKPKHKWNNVTTCLKDINSRELHYMKIPDNHIVIDFDLKNESGEKDLNLNLKAASTFPPTYMETSKSGKGIHLHYIYDGDINNLSRMYEDDIEIKMFSGNASLRRKLTKCNSLDIAHITSGLPKKKKGGSILYKDVEIIMWNEKKMRTAIENNLKKMYHANTRPSVDFIIHIFEQAEKTGVKYDLRDMKNDIIAFAASSTHQAEECLKRIKSINYCTIDMIKDTPDIQKNNSVVPVEDLVFFDVEVYPNLFVVVYKPYKKNKVTLINPTKDAILDLMQMNLVGYNNRRYDNHILYARALGEDNFGLYRQSQRIINDKDANAGMYSAAYELSYADIYDYITDKKSLKAWEVELGLKHDECEFDWDKPVPEDQFERVAEYCGNDVDATEAVFDYTYADYLARLILADLSKLSVNATTNSHSMQFIFGDDKEPQKNFNYTDLSTIFPGYKFEYGKSSYLGEDPSEGGYVYAEPGVYKNVVLLDIESMHPTSAEQLEYFGPYTKRFSEIKKARLYLKHGELDKLKDVLDGVLLKYIDNGTDIKMLSKALKIVINAIYGLSSAHFDNRCKHPDNIDNIIAKRGSLFMINLKHYIQGLGYKVCHIKTDSVKVPDYDDFIVEKIQEYGKQYGYDFELEAVYDKLALINKAVYICHDDPDFVKPNEPKWHATGKQLAEPYVFKTMFSNEDVIDTDFGQIKQSKKAPMYLGERFVGKFANVYASLTGEELQTVDENDKRSYVNGTKGYKWKQFHDFESKDDIDFGYYNTLIESAYNNITSVGDIKELLDDTQINKIKPFIHS